MNRRASVLGTAPATARVTVREKAGWLRRRSVPHEFEYLDWTVDGMPLREVVAWPGGEVADEVTPIRNGHALREYEADYLRALLGEPLGREAAVMPDGRVPLLVCRIDVDLDCRALTAQVTRDDHAVRWRDIAWQAAYEPLDLTEQEMPVKTLTFERQQYDDVVRPLLEAVPTS